MRTRRAMQATLIGDTEAGSAAVEAARAVGALLARLGITLVTGGRGGVMEAASRGAVEAGGRSVAILPTDRLGDANPWCDVVIPTGLGHARNALTVLAGDVVIAIGGGAGTLSEMALAWIHQKPVLALEGHGGWAARLAGERVDARRPDRVVACADLAALEAELRKLAGGRR